MKLNRIKELLEQLSFKKGSKALYEDPDFGEFEVTVIKDSPSYEDTADVYLKERTMNLHVRKDRLKPLNKDVII